MSVIQLGKLEKPFVMFFLLVIFSETTAYDDNLVT